MSEEARGLLLEIQAELERQRLWESVPPAPEALASTAPFCFDTLEFNQWLQWVFLPRTHALLDAGGRFPAECRMAPMAEWYLEQAGIESDALLRLVRRFDDLWNP